MEITHNSIFNQLEHAGQLPLKITINNKQVTINKFLEISWTLEQRWNYITA